MIPNPGRSPFSFCFTLKITFLLFLLSTFSAYSQQIKIQTGISVWRKDGAVSDSVLGFIYNYDTHQRRISEWYLSIDSMGRPGDINYVELDSLGRMVYFQGKDMKVFRELDSLGNLIRLVYYRASDTLILNYTSVYDDRGRLISAIQVREQGDIINGKTTIRYRYRGRTTISYTSTISVNIKKVDRKKRIIYTKVEAKIGSPYSESSRYKRDKKGNVLVYIKKVNGKRVKKTVHHYKNGIEVYQVEHFYNPDYQVVTYFTYEYW